MKPKFDKRREGESLHDYMKRHHATLDDPLNEGITDEEAKEMGTLAEDDDPVYTEGHGGIIGLGQRTDDGLIKPSIPSRAKKRKPRPIR